jgi:hypothetical protein
MVSQNLYEESGNLIMRGTNAHKHAKKSKKNNSKNMEKDLKSMKKSELIKKFHELIDPDHTENVSGETKDQIIERITTVMKNFNGGGRRKRTRRLRKLNR